MLTLGLRPLEVDVLLPRGADFVASIKSTTGPWPAGTGVALVFLTGPRQRVADGVRWDAEVVGDSAAWDVPWSVVEDAIDGGVTHARLLYIEPDATVLLWGKGDARVV